MQKDHRLKPRSMKASAVRVDLRDPVQQDMVMREVARAEAVCPVRHGITSPIYTIVLRQRPSTASV